MALDLLNSKLAKGIEAEGGAIGSTAAVQALKGRRTRDLDLTVIEKGDIITLPKPEDLDKYISNQKIGKDKYPFLLVEVKKDGGAVEAAQLFPGVFERSIQPYVLSDGVTVRNGDRVKSSGSAVDEFQKYGNNYDSFKALCETGKKLLVKDVTPVETRAFGSTTELTTRNAYQIELK